MKKIAALTLVLAMVLMFGMANAQQQNPPQGNTGSTPMMHGRMMAGMHNGGGKMRCPMMQSMQQGGNTGTMCPMMQSHQGNGAAQTTPPATPSKP